MRSGQPFGDLIEPDAWRSLRNRRSPSAPEEGAGAYLLCRNGNDPPLAEPSQHLQLEPSVDELGGDHVQLLLAAWT
jgi:hypothetical protein